MKTMLSLMLLWRRGVIQWHDSTPKAQAAIDGARELLESVASPRWRHIFLTHLSRDCNSLAAVEASLSVLRNLWAAWRLLEKARNDRDPLDLDLPERRVVLDENGRIAEIALRDKATAYDVVALNMPWLGRSTATPKSAAKRSFQAASRSVTARSPRISARSRSKRIMICRL